MAGTGPIHHVGTFLLFVAFLFLLISSISSPVVSNIYLLKINFNNYSSVTFGSLGYCVNYPAPTPGFCYGSTVGYPLAGVVQQTTGIFFSIGAAGTANGLTSALVLHPIACGLAFTAFVLAIQAGVIRSLFSALIALIAWILTLIVMSIDFALFGSIRNHVNDSFYYNGISAQYGAAIWTCMVAMICLFLGTIIVLFSCYSARLHRAAVVVHKHKTAEEVGAVVAAGALAEGAGPVKAAKVGVEAGVATAVVKGLFDRFKKKRAEKKKVEVAVV